MAYSNARRSHPGAIFPALFGALQWRLLLLWTLLLLLPTLVAALPLHTFLGGLLDHSVHAEEWARGFDLIMVGDIVNTVIAQQYALSGALMASVALAVLLQPWLSGMAVTSGRNSRGAGFGELLQGGLEQYGRMFRLLLWSLLPYAAAAWLVSVGLDMADDRGDKAVLQSQADTALHTAAWAGGFVVVIVQAWVESARAAFIADPGLRSATVAMGRGLLQLLRRPLGTLLNYLLVTAIGLGIVLLLGLWRIRVTPLGAGGWLLAFVITQLLVATLGWMRLARLLVLAEVGRSLGGGSRRQDWG